MDGFDVVVVGGGPAGSSAARHLGLAGMRVAVVDRARFPRVKLCAGWLSAPVWDVLERRPESYPGGLWPWHRCHVDFGGRRHTIKASGYFIRRYEFDHWLLQQSGAEVIEHTVKQIRRDGDQWVIDDRLRARFVIGAGGTHCPVARALFPKKPRRPVGAQELELRADPDEVAATRVGGDGEPQLLLHDDLRGYSWNIPKTDWVNVGCGTMSAKQVRDAWSRARDVFADGSLPAAAAAELDHAKGHSYYLFDPAHLAAVERDGAALVGDALGLAQPLTAEGILPAILSGRLAAEAIARGDLPSYRAALANHPVMVDYALLYRLREAGSSLRGRGGGAGRLPRPGMIDRLSKSVVATGFAWMFSGKPLPGRPIIRLLRRN